MVDMLIPDLFEIGFSKEMVCWVIFGVKHQILDTKTKILGRMVFFWGSDGAPDGWGW